MSTSILSVRVNETERSLLEAAAKQAHTTLSEFVRRKAVESAELEVMERRIIEIPVALWEQFEAWLDEPAKEIPALKRLAASTPVWEK
ncbi:DUF1778 domain-containing protein [Thiothrix nivea]|uniref:DUF1778 domain-containing protein n=1 Tax=Thiothrix nivea (strain ATCC 35100 / DSM 5205 / JP2) TaxID=870187 RepID=A0A656HCV3_THINJ|nr:DUF1778 domain-containing protein [Thiothrix nivea]EIJ34971.1 protein of unknown function DUF1778 [Thiothrix nivea DSM 5205]